MVLSPLRVECFVIRNGSAGEGRPEGERLEVLRRGIGKDQIREKAEKGRERQRDAYKFIRFFQGKEVVETRGYHQAGSFAGGSEGLVLCRLT